MKDLIAGRRTAKAAKVLGNFQELNDVRQDVKAFRTCSENEE